MPAELTLLEQLDAAETRLIQAEYRLHEARNGRAGGRDFAGALRSAEVDLVAAATHVADSYAATSAAAVKHVKRSGHSVDVTRSQWKMVRPAAEGPVR